MHIRVIGSNMDIGQSLTSFVEENLEKSVRKYFDTAIHADVHFSKEKQGNLFSVNIMVHEGVKGGGIVVKSNASAGDPYAAFTESADKAAKQLRRYKRKIKNYRRQRGGLKSLEPSFDLLQGTKYVLPVQYDVFAEMESEEKEEENHHEEKLDVLNEKNTDIEELSVNDAIMKMDLADLPALVFINKTNKRVNVVYYRKDGNISWIDPKI